MIETLTQHDLVTKNCKSMDDGVAMLPAALPLMRACTEAAVTRRATAEGYMSTKMVAELVTITSDAIALRTTWECTRP